MRRLLILGPFVAIIAVAATPLRAGIDHLWLASADLGGAWEVLAEAPARVAGDPDLVAWGVRAQETRHYTRHGQGRVEVCSVEIWEFASEAQARAAHEGFAFPDWSIEREGPWLLMLRSRSFARGGTQSRAVFAACREIGRRVRERAALTTID